MQAAATPNTTKPSTSRRHGRRLMKAPRSRQLRDRPSEIVIGQAPLSSALNQARSENRWCCSTSRLGLVWLVQEIRQRRAVHGDKFAGLRQKQADAG